MSNGTISAPPRLCHVVKVPDFDGYGFNLHAEKGKPGQYIGKVDEGSPAEAAGLKPGDRIIEVNGVSIANETHKQVVQRIKTLQDETKLLVVTPPPEEVPNLDVPDNKNNNKEIEITPPQTETKEPAKLNLGMTAAEMRAQLAAKKKFDAKKVPMDLKSKFDIVKKL